VVSLARKRAIMHPRPAGACTTRIRPVGYDQELAARIRLLIAGVPGVAEKKMFGGLAFLVGGNMAVAASSKGGIMVRADPADSDALVAGGPASLVEMRGHAMPGWLRVGAAGLDDDELARWVDRGLRFARSLPARR
jgi:TfoX/Sxy family transcriptional regulator of competence genes